MLITMNVTL